MSDVNFAKQFDENGVSNRLIYPVRNSNNIIVSYKITKTAMVVAGDTRIYKKTITARDLVPFMEIVIPVEKVMNVESVLVKDGVSFQTDPTYGEFYDCREEFQDSKGRIVNKYFEVDCLAQQDIWKEKVIGTNQDGTAKIDAVWAGGVYKIKGSVSSESSLPSSGQVGGDVYIITQESDYGPAGTKVVWDGSQ